jgi:hypothetical protein
MTGRRFIRIGDAPDTVHLAAVGKELIRRGGVMAYGGLRTSLDRLCPPTA